MRKRFSNRSYFLLVAFFVSSILLYFWNIQIAKADPTTWYANSSAAAGGNGSIGSPFNTFHAAYTAAAASGDTINLTGTFDWTNDAGGETGDAVTSGYTLSKNLTIQGQGATETIIQADDTPYTANRRIFTLGSGKTITLQDLTIRHGYTSSSAHAIDASYANLTMLRTITTLNRSSLTYQDGGTAILHNGDSNIFIMRNSTVSENGNMSGYNNYTGGITVYSANNLNEITNSTFYHNSGAYNGAVYLRGYLTVTNSTFVANRGTVSGTDIHSFGSNSIAYVKNSIFADSGGVASLVAQSGGAVTDGGYNIVETQSGTNFVNGVNGNIVGNQANLNIAASLEDNNTLYDTPTLAISAGSVAINAGDPSDGVHHGIAIPTEDQRGAARPDRTDIGAYEYGGMIDIIEPTTPASSVTFSSVTYSQAIASWTNGNGGRRAVFVKAASSGAAEPVDGQAYAANSIFGLGDQIGETGWYCVYSGTGTTVTVTNLLSSTVYRTHVVEYNGTLAGTYNYLTAAGTDNPNNQLTGQILSPTMQTSAISLSSVGSTGATIGFTVGDGEKRAVFMKASAITDSLSIVDTDSYTSSSVFGSGEQIGTSGWYCVYSGSGSSVAVTGLSSMTTYLVQAIEYNGSTNDERYLQEFSTDNPKAFKTSSEASIGSGTSTTSSTTGAPINKYYYSLHGQSIYTAAEINAAGMTGPVSITGIGFYVATAPSSSLANFVIRMKHTSATNVLSWQTVTGMSTVYSSGSYMPTAGGFDMITLTTPFSWNGTDNIVVDTAFSVSSGSGGTVRYTTLSDGYRYARSDGSDQTNTFSGGSSSSYKPNIKFAASSTTPYTLAYSAGVHGSISGDKVQAVSGGSNGSAVTAVADEGYEFDNWSDDSTDNPRTDVAISENKYLTANFSIINYSLRYYASQPGPGAETAHGSLVGDATQSVEFGSSGTAVTAVANTGYHFVRWSDGATSNPRIDTNIAAAVNTYAVFEINNYTLSYSATDGGYISGSTCQSIDHSLSGSAVFAVANSGYEFVGWSDGQTNNPRIDSNVTANISVAASFELIPIGPTQESSNTNSSENSTSSIASIAVVDSGLLPIIAGSTKADEYALPTGVAQTTVAQSANTITKEYFTEAYEKEGVVYFSEIRFRIVDEAGNPVVGILVVLHSQPREAFTNEDGYAVFKDVESGDHRIVVAYNGKTVAKKIAIDEPEIKNQELKLEAIEIKVKDENDIHWLLYLFAALGLVSVPYLVFSIVKKKKK